MSNNVLEQKISSLEKQVFLLEKKLARTLNSRKDAEKLLEEKSWQLYIALGQQKELIVNLEEKKKELNTKLEDSKDDFKFLLDNIIDIVYEVDNTGVITKMNGGFYRILGYSIDDLIGRNFVEFLPEDYLEDVVVFYQEQIFKLQNDSFREIPLKAKEGNVIWLEQTVKLIINDGQFIKAIVVARDISIQRQERGKHEAERARLNLLIDNMPQAILLEDEHRKIVKVNDEFCNLFSIPAKPYMLVGADCSKSAEESKHLFENSDDFENKIEIALKNRELVTKQYLKMTNGKVLLRDYIPINKDNVYLGHMWVYHDMTAMVQKDFLLVQNELRYSNTLENLELGILEVDCDEKITKVFPKFEMLTGYSAQELIGKNAKEMLLNVDNVAVADEINNRRLLKKSSAYETTIKTKEGSIKNVLISGAPMLNERGEVTGSIGIHFDITEMKNLEKYLRKAKEEADTAKKAEQIFTARMSHEVKTPLTALQGALALMENQITDNRLLGYLNSATEAAVHLRSLVDDILDISRLKAGKFKPNFEKFELRPFLKSLSENFRILANEKGLELVYIYEPETINDIILDKKMLYQIVTNLLSNAIKFTEKGFVGINVTSKLKEKNKYVLIIDVFDSGIGISNDDKGVIFGNYGRSNQVENSFDGAGLGLGIVKGFVDVLKGEVSVTSEIGKGSCFTLRFIINLDKKISLTKTEINRIDKIPLNEIVIVDDSHQIRSYAKSVLDDYHLKVSLFADGYSALRYLKTVKYPQAIILDYRMPFLTGVDVALKLKEIEYQGKIILMSASPIETLEELTKGGNIDALLTKPFLPKDLIALLAKYFILTKSNIKKRNNDDFYIASFNNEHIKNIYGTNARYFKESINIFLREIDRTIEAMQTDLKTQNCKELSFKLHKLKPSLNMVNLVELSKKVAIFQKSVVEDFDSSKTEQLINEIAKEVEQHKINLNKQLNWLVSYV